MERTRHETGTPWEPRVGYSRAVRVGPYVQVSGTTAVDDAGEVVAVDDAYGQAVHVLGRIREALSAVGAGLEHVVRTRMYVTDIADWQDVGRAHGEVFSEIRPASTMVEVSGLIDPRMRVEIEVDAIVP